MCRSARSSWTNRPSPSDGDGLSWSTDPGRGPVRPSWRGPPSPSPGNWAEMAPRGSPRATVVAAEATQAALPMEERPARTGAPGGSALDPCFGVHATAFCLAVTPLGYGDAGFVTATAASAASRGSTGSGRRRPVGGGLPDRPVHRVRAADISTEPGRGATPARPQRRASPPTRPHPRARSGSRQAVRRRLVLHPDRRSLRQGPHGGAECLASRRSDPAGMTDCSPRHRSAV
jgi:hypothetical protein